MIVETCCDYDASTKKNLLSKWAQGGATDWLVGVIAAAQRQRCPKVIFAGDGMVVERRKIAKICKIGSKGLSRKHSTRLLRGLKMVHDDLWPIEQLANVVNLYARKTRKSGGRK